MTHSRKFYLLDNEPSVDDCRYRSWSYIACGAYPAYFPAEDRIGVVFYSPWAEAYYPSYLDETAGFYDDAWEDHPLTRLDP